MTGLHLILVFKDVQLKLCHYCDMDDLSQYDPDSIYPDSDVLEFFIPYHNSFNYLVECLSSLKAQDFPTFKVTVIDDGSSDDQAELHIIQMQDSRFSYIKNSENLGLPQNFQKCVDRARSDWVVILGHDDRLPPDYVRSLSIHLHDKSIGFIQPKVDVIDSAGGKSHNLADSVKFFIRKCIIWAQKNKKSQVAIKIESRAILPWFFFGNPFYFPTIVWNRTVLQSFGFNQNLPITLDYDLIFRILNNGFSVTFLQDVSAIYRRHGESASGKLTSMLERLDEETRVLKTFGVALEKNSLLMKLMILIRPTIRFHALVLTLSEIKSGRIRSANRFFTRFYKI